MPDTEPVVVSLSDSCTIIRGDCREILHTLKGFDAVVTDPPYGIGYVHGYSGKKMSANQNLKPIIGDDSPFDPAILLRCEGRSKMPQAYESAARTPLRAVVMLGANHYSQRIPERGQWLVWDKSCGQGAANNYVDAEFAWMNRRNSRCIFRHFWMGCLRAGEDNQGKSARRHPSQKPVELMAWLIETARIGVGKTVLDPYMGVGSTGVACLRSGRKFVGIEIDAEYFEIARERLGKVVAEMSAGAEGEA